MSTKMLDDELHIPLHIQISKILEERIHDGVFQDKIPSERALMNEFSVSRTTIREAIARLVNIGILKRIRGKGTFVTKKSPIEDWLSTLNSFTDTVKNMGMEPGSKLLKTDTFRRGVVLSDIFDTDIFSIKRLRYANEKPVAIEQHYYSIELGKQLATYDLETATIYHVLEEELNVNLIEAEQLISNKTVDKETARYLEIPKDSSVLHIERTIYNEFEQPVEFYEGLYRPDMYVFKVRSKRKFT